MISSKTNAKNTTTFFCLKQYNYNHIKQAKCRNKTIKIYCGKNPIQNIRWLGNVAVARLTPNLDGWKTNGFAQVVAKDGVPLSFDAEICKVLKRGDTVTVETSLDGNET